MTIQEGRSGVLIHCFAGCEKKAILEAASLTWTDLFYDAPNDYDLQRKLRERERLERERDTRRKATRQVALRALNDAGMWESIAQVLAARMARYPDSIDAKIAPIFHHALWMARKAEWVADGLDPVRAGHGFARGNLADATSERVGKLTVWYLRKEGVL